MLVICKRARQTEFILYIYLNRDTNNPQWGNLPYRQPFRQIAQKLWKSWKKSQDFLGAHIHLHCWAASLPSIWLHYKNKTKIPKPHHFSFNKAQCPQRHSWLHKMLIYEVLGYIKRIGFRALQSCCSKQHKINKDGEVESEGSREETNCPYTEEFLLEPWFHAKRTKIAMSFTSLLFSPSVRGIAKLEYSLFLLSGIWPLLCCITHHQPLHFFCYNTILWKKALLGLF